MPRRPTLLLAFSVCFVSAALGAPSAGATAFPPGTEAGEATGVPSAKLLPGRRAVAPPAAPPAAKAMIEAANRIRHRPYIWGGGHRSWTSRGYDCSGSVSYVMHAAGLLDWALDSTGFMRWGDAGAGQW